MSVEITKKEIWEGWNNAFIRGYRVFDRPDGKLHLKSEEFYMYSLLNLLEVVNGLIITSISIIENILPISYSNNINYCRKRIKENIKALWKKKVIIVENVQDESDFDNIKPNTTLLIEINDEYIDENSLDKAKGYEQISAESFIKARSMTDYYIHYVVAKWRDRGFACSFKRWGEILGVTPRRAMTIVYEAVENKAIFVNIGGKLSWDKQEMNIYKVTGFTEEEKTKATKKREKDLYEDDNPF